MANDAGRVWRGFVFVLFGGLWYLGILAPAGSKSVVNREGQSGLSALYAFIPCEYYDMIYERNPMHD